MATWPLLLSGLSTSATFGQTALPIDGTSFEGVLHDNRSNAKRQGSGLAPLILKSFPGRNLYRDDAVGINFEHLFNGAKEQYEISMFTPRRDPCHLTKVGERRYELHWPSEDSRWGVDARMVHDLSNVDRVDLLFECTPSREVYPQRFLAMMWASYMNRAIDRRIHFWGTDGDATGWVTFGEGTGKEIEVGTVSHAGAANLPYEKGSQTLNLVEHPTKKFITPFYYGLLDGDHDPTTANDKLLYLVLFDQTESIRFAMWNFFKNNSGEPDTHSPAWDWQFVIHGPQVGQRSSYRARIVVKPFQGPRQVWEEYRKWGLDLGVPLPEVDDAKMN